MREFVLVLASIALTAVSWGVYGVLIRQGTSNMGSHLLPFVWVGLAYCAIAVVAPVFLLRLWGEKGSWTVTGFAWSFVAGVAGALGALGVVLALSFGGSSSAVYVMPLVFGGAPVVNTFVSMYMSKTYKQASPLFYAGLILVLVGALCVLIFKPTPVGGGGGHGVVATAEVMLEVGLAIGLTVLSWGVYGPILHKGQMLMQGSRLRPLICVGLAYFAVAVVVTPLIIQAWHGSVEWDKMNLIGSLWSFAGGSAGAFGAIGIILAFTFGGKPTYVMPLVFGGAPVINTLVTVGPDIARGVITEINPFFFAGLIVIIAGAATVLIFAPKAAPHPPGK